MSKKYLSRIGKKGGQSRSEAKRAAARENGKRGGRPKTVIIETEIKSAAD